MVKQGMELVMLRRAQSQRAKIIALLLNWKQVVVCLQADAHESLALRRVDMLEREVDRIQEVWGREKTDLQDRDKDKEKLKERERARYEELVTKMLTHRGLKAIALAAWVDTRAAASHRHLHLTRRLHRTRARRQQTETCAWRTVVLKARAFQAREDQGRQNSTCKGGARGKWWCLHGTRMHDDKSGFVYHLPPWTFDAKQAGRSRHGARTDCISPVQSRRARGNRFLCSIILRWHSCTHLMQVICALHTRAELKGRKAVLNTWIASTRDDRSDLWQWLVVQGRARRMRHTFAASYILLRVDAVAVHSHPHARTHLRTRRHGDDISHRAHTHTHTHTYV
jgi:hypothetical protein